MKLKVLFAGDSIAKSTGLSYVILSLMKLFYDSNKYDVAFVALSGDTVKKDSYKVHGSEYQQLFESVPLYNAPLLDPKKFTIFDTAVCEFRPNIVISMIDPWLQDSIAYSSYRKTFYWVNYVTIETPDYPKKVKYPTPINPLPRKSIKEILESADIVIPCTHMGQKCLKKMGVTCEDFIYLGIDFNSHSEIVPGLDRFSVFSGTVRDDDFLFMSISVNSDRKCLYKLIEALAVFKEKMKDTMDKYKLYIHTDANKPHVGTDLTSLAENLGLDHSVLFPGLGDVTKKDLYNRLLVSDCYISLSGGEGFGYGYVEAMMHKKPIIYMNYGGHVEFCKEVGLAVKPLDYFYPTNAAIKFALADLDDAAKQMARMVSDPTLRKRLGEKGFEKSKEFDWSIVGKKFIEVVENSFMDVSINPLSQFKLKRII